ncbi:MAG: transcription antitermination factor NusB [Treponema sp.]|nr:transcription antitermination factor NusB [Treponema sp.]MBQ6568017.1 transcription antitermination factor NusB [Treponema sp.]MBQ7168162.1 transcription antitermination factor NusB [Treponema sp.]
MSRHKARVLAFQALFSYDVGGEGLEDLLTLNWAENAGELDTETSDFARMLIAGTVNHLPEVDSCIKGHLAPKWHFDRLNRVTVAILRISIFSLLYQKDMPVNVVIDQAIKISKEFGEDDAFKFINAMLDNISKGLPAD